MAPELPTHAPATAGRPGRRAIGALLSLAFLVAIFAPGVKTLLSPHPPSEILVERRQPSKRPGLPTGLRALTAFPDAFETWFNDFFGFRIALIRWHNIAKLALGVSPSSTFTLGKDGWMFIGFSSVTDGFRAVKPFRKQELEYWQRILEQRRDWCASMGTRYVFVIAPDKCSIYPEYMPDRFNRVNAESRWDQLLAHMRAHSDVSLIDLRDPLIRAKARGLVYEPLDSHWNEYGAWVAQDVIITILKRWFPTLAPFPLERFEWRVRHDKGLTWGKALHLEDRLLPTYVELTRRGPPHVKWLSNKEYGGVAKSAQRWESDADGAPTAVLWRDSFGHMLAPALAPHFSSLTTVWTRDETPATLVKLVEQEHPDVLIEELVERWLMNDRPDPLPVGRPAPRPRLDR